jgi:hydroxyacylglutathione hydrolase
MPCIVNAYGNYIGKFFEGSSKDMRYLIQKLVRLIPEDTFIWPGHEYAYGNLSFANEMEPGNFVLQVSSITL